VDSGKPYRLKGDDEVRLSSPANMEVTAGERTVIT